MEYKMQLKNPKAQAVHKAQQLTPEPYFPEFLIVGSGEEDQIQWTLLLLK